MNSLIQNSDKTFSTISANDNIVKFNPTMSSYRTNIELKTNRLTIIQFSKANKKRTYITESI